MCSSAITRQYLGMTRTLTELNWLTLEQFKAFSVMKTSRLLRYYEVRFLLNSTHVMERGNTRDAVIKGRQRVTGHRAIPIAFS